MVQGDGGEVEMWTHRTAWQRLLLSDNNETHDLESRVEVISPGTGGVFWKVCASFPESCGITTGNQALRNGN